MDEATFQDLKRDVAEARRRYEISGEPFWLSQAQFGEALVREEYAKRAVIAHAEGIVRGAR